MNEFDDNLRFVMERACEKHARTPNQSFEQYRRQRYEELDSFMSARKTVYLDMKFWIWFRDPDGSPCPTKVRQLLDQLRTGLKDKHLLCPISYPVFVELMKQNPPERRRSQAKIMDELCEGIGIRNPFDIAEQEFLRFFAKHCADFKRVPIDPIWVPIGHMIVDAYTQCNLLPQDSMELTRKVMLDMGWTLTMDEIARKMDSCHKSPAMTATKINIERQTHQRMAKPFSQLFADELHGLLDVTTPQIETSFKQAAAFSGVNPDSVNLDEKERRFCVNLLREVVTQARDNAAIPSLRIKAALHAALRLDDNYLFKENDLVDIQHSAVAVAYCNVFLTERQFASKLRLPMVQNVINSGCKIIDELDEAISVLS